YEQAVIYLILNQDPEDIRKFRDDVPDKLLSILEKLIAKEKEERYEDLSSLFEDLKNITKQEEKDTFQLPAPTPSQSIAVMPFVNVSNDPEQEYFCDGLTEELINSLSRIRNLKVVARTSAFAFKGGSIDVRKAGRKLDVRTILEGSVRKDGNRIRITAQLINVLDGYHLWSERYEMDMRDLFKIQDEITLAIVDVLKVKLLENEKEKMLKRYTDNMEAYNLCQRGFFTFNQIDFTIFEKCIGLYNEALNLDPNYALAYYGLGYTHFGNAVMGLKRPSEIIGDFRKCVNRILEIDKNLSEGYDLLGLLKAVFEWNKPEAQKAWQHCLELNPNSANALANISILFSTKRQFDLAKKYAERARAIDPLSEYTESSIVYHDFYTNQFDKVYKRLSKYLDVKSRFLVGLLYLWRTLTFLNRKAEAVKVCKEIFLIIGLNDVASAMDKAGIDNAFLTAADILAEIYKHHYLSPYDIALLYSHAGKQEQAMHWIEEALEVTDPKVIYINAEPEWRNIREEQRFKKYIKKAGY
ncbi:MAG: TPR end-of-group domain-containing protein, partial [Bacillota bacterium]